MAIMILIAVLKQYEEALSRLPNRLAALQPSTALSVEAFNPDADLKALIEGNRTGPFKPKPMIYESLETDVPEVNFGIDLRRWAGDQGWKAVKAPSRPKGSVPEALEGLLKGLEGMYQEIPQDGELLNSTVLDKARNYSSRQNDAKRGCMRYPSSRLTHFAMLSMTPT